MGKGYPEQNVVERSSLRAFSHPEPFSHVILSEAKDPQIAAGEEPALSRSPEPQAKEQRRDPLIDLWILRDQGTLRMTRWGCGLFATIV